MNETNNFTRFFINVKKCKNLNWQEKAILSEIISYQLSERVFKQKDLTLAIELGMDKGTISKLINRLYKRDIINKVTISFPPEGGGKFKRQRTITVIDIAKWTKEDAIPTVKGIELKREKKQIIAEVIDAKQAHTSNNLITLDSEKDINNSAHIGKVIIAQIKNKKEIEFNMVNVKFGNDIFQDEATLIPNSQNKYYLKSTLKSIDASVFV